LGCGKVGTGDVARDTMLEFPHDSLNVQRLVSEQVPLDPGLSQPFGHAAVGEYLLIVDRDGPPYAWLVDPETGLTLATGGAQGEGPGAFGMAPQVIGEDPSEPGVIWFFESLRRRLVALRIRSDSGTLRLEAFKEAQVGPGLSRMWWHADRFITRQTDWQAITANLAWFDRDGQTERVGRSLALDDKRFNGQELLSAFDLTLCSRPDGDRIAMPFVYQGRGVILDSRGDSIAPMRVPFPAPTSAVRHPVLPSIGFKNGEPGVRRHYFHCIGTQSRVLAVYAGRLNRATPRDTDWHRIFLHAFDWTGVLREVYELDHGAYTVAISSDHQWLYTTGLTGDGTTALLRKTRVDAGRF
jgi:hypothetical protein